MLIKGIIDVKPKQEYKIYFPLDLVLKSPEGKAKERILELLHEDVQ